MSVITAQMIKDAAENVGLDHVKGGYNPGRDNTSAAAVKISYDNQASGQIDVWIYRLAMAIAIQIAMEFTEASEVEDALENETREPRVEQLGKGVIVYWPGIAHDPELD